MCARNSCSPGPDTAYTYPYLSSRSSSFMLRRDDILSGLFLFSSEFLRKKRRRGVSYIIRTRGNNVQCPANCWQCIGGQKKNPVNDYDLLRESCDRHPDFSSRRGDTENQPINTQQSSITGRNPQNGNWAGPGILRCPPKAPFPSLQGLSRGLLDC